MESEFDVGLDWMADDNDFPTVFGCTHSIRIQFGVDLPDAQQSRSKLNLGLSNLTQLNELAPSLRNSLLILSLPNNRHIQPQSQRVLQSQLSHRMRAHNRN